MEPTYAFKNGNVYTISGGKVIASVKESEFEEPQDNFSEDPEIQLPDPPDDLQEDMLADIVTCPACGESADSADSFCSNCGEPLANTGLSGFGDDGGFDTDMMNARMVAKVTTPNGLEGKVVNRTPSLWGDEVTVRFANGRVKTMPVTADMKFSEEQDDNFGGSPVEGLISRLASSVMGDMESLKERKSELASIQTDVANQLKGASVEDRATMDEIAREAAAESREIDDAIQHLVELEGRNFVPTAAFESRVVSQASLGRGSDGAWLNEVISNMNKEARGTDFVKLLNEGPEIFITGSDDVLVADAGATRQAATRYVRSFTSSTAGTTSDEQRARFETQFLSRVEECRKGELSSRKEAVKKEASSIEDDAANAPDAGLFL